MRRALLALALALLAASCSGGEGAEDLGVAETVDVSPSPGAIAVGPDGEVWVTAGNRRRHRLVRLSTGVGVHLTGTPTDLVADSRRVWVVGTDFPDDGTPPRAWLTEVDARSGQVRRLVRLGRGALSGVALGHGSLWITDSREDRLYRFDPTKPAIQASISISGGPTSVATDDRYVWVTTPGTGKLHRVDPETGVPDEFALTGSLPSQVVAGDGGVWVSNYGDENVVRVNPETLEVEEKLGFDTSASRLALAGDVLAVAEAEGRRLTILDLASGDRSVLEDRFLVDVGLAGDRAWVVDHGHGAVLRVQISRKISR